MESIPFHELVGRYGYKEAMRIHFSGDFTADSLAKASQTASKLTGATITRTTTVGSTGKFATNRLRGDVKQYSNKAIADAMDGMGTIIAAWASDVVYDRKRRIKINKLQNTGALHDSVRYELSKLGGQNYLVRIRYNFYGKFHDKGIRGDMAKGGSLYQRSLIQWVMKKGLGNFKERRPGRGLTGEQRARDIAWGIIKANSKASPWKRRKWLNPVRNDIGSLQESMNVHFSDVIVRDHVAILTS